MKIKTGLIVGAVVVAAAALMVPRFMKQEEAIEVAIIPSVQAENPVNGDILVTSSLMGTIEAADTVYITPKLAGEVTDVYVKTGDMIEKGQKILTIENKQIDSARINMNTAKISMEDAQTNLKRMKALFDSGDISAQSYEQVASSAEIAKLQYEAAKLNYDTQVEYSTIVSTASGKVESCDVEVHDMISQSTVVCIITGEGNKSVAFSVTERVVNGLHLGDSIELDKAGTVREGVITEVASMVDPQTGLFKVKASIADSEALAAGTYVKLTVVAERRDDVMKIPVDAVYYDGGQAYVYLFDQGTVKKQDVVTGLSDDTHIQIQEGLTLEDQVITTWTSDLYDGAQVVLAAQ